MRQISEGIYGLLVSQGLANAKPVGAGKVRGKVAQPIGVGAAVKRAGTEAPAKSNREVSANAQEPSPSREEARPVPRIVIDNSRNWRTQAPRVAPLGVRQFLVLVQ